MEIKFFSIKKLDKEVNRSYINARKVWKNVKVDYITSKHIGFTVLGHSVIYFSERKFPKSWNCDCPWYSIKGKFCKHILAVFIRLNKDKNFLKKFKKIILNYQEQHE